MNCSLQKPGPVITSYRTAALAIAAVAGWCSPVLAVVAAQNAVAASTVRVPTCLARNLALRLGTTQAAAGNVGTPVIITNTGARACTLDGFPTISARTREPSPRRVRFIDESVSQIYVNVTPRLVRVAPHGVASFGISYGDNLDQNYGDTARCQMDSLGVNLPHVIHAIEVAVGAHGMDGFGPINVCFSNFKFGLTPVVTGSTPPGP
jgi:hypothetical protein